MTSEFAVLLVAMFASALVACALTLVVATWVFGRRARALRAEIEQDLDRATTEAAARIGDEVETRVRRGVRNGIREGITSLPSRAVVESTTRAAAKAGAELIGEGLSALLGASDRREP